MHASLVGHRTASPSPPPTPLSWNRNVYRWRAGPGGTDQLLSRLDQNLFVTNYFSTIPIDQDDGSSRYLDTNNVMLWGGSKSLMGYAKHHVGAAMVYVDLSPSLHAAAAQRVGWSAPESKPPMCAGMLVPTPALPGFAEVWVNNSCIATDPSHFYRFGSCNASNPLDGSIPMPLGSNRLDSPNATYQLRCGSATWGLEDAQARGVDVGSTLHVLPTTDELLAMLSEILDRA